MNDYRPNGCKMYVAIREIDFPTDFGEEDLHISKGDVWMLKQETFNGRVLLNKEYTDKNVLQITMEQLESDFIEVNIQDINMSTYYKFFDTEYENNMCTQKVLLNGYEVSTDTYSMSFDDFCERMEYPLNEWMH